MTNNLIRNKQKNDLLTQVNSADLDTNLFTAKNEAIDGIDYFVIRLRDSPMLFAIRQYPESFNQVWFRYSSFRPNFPLSTDNWGEWSHVIAVFQKWLYEHAREYLDDISTPNLWQILEDTRSNTIHEYETANDLKFFST